MIVPQQYRQGPNATYSVLYGIGGFIVGIVVAILLIILGMMSPLGRDAGALAVIVMGLLMTVPLGFVFAGWFARIGSAKPSPKPGARPGAFDYFFYFLVSIAAILAAYILFFYVKGFIFR